MVKTSALCVNCQSTEFYTDDQGDLICVHCGTQSQDYFAESHDVEDGLVTTQIGGRYISAAKPPSRRRMSGEISDDSSKKSEGHPDLVEFMMLYQFSLQFIFNAVCDAAGIDPTQRKLYFATLGSLWSGYLYAWNAAECSCKMSFAFARKNESCSCPNGELRHPLFPSKPLLLGFSYLSLRLHKSWVIPSDIVRWCEYGKVPYNNLWECLPSTKKSLIPDRYKALYTTMHKGKTMFVTCSNILFHANSIAESIHLTVPPLNAPLVARTIISSLGLPNQVWLHYTNVAQILRDGKPFRGAEASDQHYVENIMAAIVTACKLCNDWMLWQYHSRESSGGQAGVPLPCCAEGAGSLPRRSLEQVLSQIRRNVPNFVLMQPYAMTTDTFKYNKGVKHVLQSDGKAKQHVSQDDTGPPLWQQGKESSTQIRMSSLQWQSQSITEELVPANLQATYRVLEGSLVRRKTQSDGADEEPQECYLTHVRHKADATGMYPEPFVALLERCARYIYVPPSLLLLLVEKIDAQLIDVAFHGRVEKKMSLGTAKSALRHINPSERTALYRPDKQKKKKSTDAPLPTRLAKTMKSYRATAKLTLPLLHEFGLNGELEPGRGPLRPEKSREDAWASCFKDSVFDDVVADDDEEAEAVSVVTNDFASSFDDLSSTAASLHRKSKKFTSNLDSGLSDFDGFSVSGGGGLGAVSSTEDTSGSDLPLPKAAKKRKLSKADSDSYFQDEDTHTSKAGESALSRMIGLFAKSQNS